MNKPREREGLMLAPERSAREDDVSVLAVVIDCSPSWADGERTGIYKGIRYCAN